MKNINDRPGLLLIALVCLTACSGGGGGESTGRPGTQSSSIAGYWTGSVTRTETGEVSNATAMIDEHGDAQLIVVPQILTFSPAPIRPPVPATGVVPADSFFVMHGNVCCAKDFNSDMVAEGLGTGLRSNARVRGSVSSEMLVGQFEYLGRPYSFSLAPSPTYERPLTMQDLAGVYSDTFTDSTTGTSTTTYSIAVNNDGVVSGQHRNGCIYNGSVSIPNTAHNLFRLRLQISACPEAGWPRNGDYEGLGRLLRDVLVFGAEPSQSQQVFAYSVIGPVWLGTQGASRQ